MARNAPNGWGVRIASSRLAQSWECWFLSWMSSPSNLATASFFFATLKRDCPILPCKKTYEHTDAPHLYGFHDLRRGFTTMNAGTLSAHALQALMRYKSYATAQRYVDMAPQSDKAVELLKVPEVLERRIGGRWVGSSCGCVVQKRRKSLS